jgi:hemolysin activation/secretion protein
MRRVALNNICKLAMNHELRVAPSSTRIQNQSLQGLLQTAGLYLLLSAAVNAQIPPSPGSISRQVMPELSPVIPAALAEQPAKSRPPSAAPGANVVSVQQWVLEGNSLLNQAEVDELLKPLTGVDITLQQIQEAAAKVQRAYDTRGWLARVFLPPQDVINGVVRMQVLEAKLGAVVLGRPEAGTVPRVRPEVVQAVVNHSLTPGGVLNTRLVNRGLLLADDLNGVSVTGQLMTGATQGSTDVLVNTEDERAWKFEAGVDNGNARSVGAWRAVVSAQWLSPSGRGESYSVQTLKSEGADFLRLGASAPLGSSGLTGNLAVSQMNYKVVTPGANGAVPRIKGGAQNLSTDLAYPLLRSRSQNLYLTAGFEQRDYNSFVEDSKQSDYRVNAFNMALSGNQFDDFGGGGSNAYSLGLVSGRVSKRDPNSNNDEATLGQYSKLRWALSRQQNLGAGLSLLVGMQGQYTGRKPLDSSENLILGGPSGVRAYPVGEASGPQGVLTTVQLRWAVTQQWLITPFVDHGRVQKRNDDNLRAYSLLGAGVGVTWTGPNGWLARATYARRSGANPNQSSTGKDQDGSLNQDRLWVNVSRSF